MTSCNGKKLASSGAASAAACCTLCTKTTNCTAWTWDPSTHQCDAMLSCDSAVAAFRPISGLQKKCPSAQWSKGQPSILPLPFRNASLPLETRLEWLVNNLSLQEKLGLLGSRTSAIPRLAIKSYMTYVECNTGAYANGHYPPSDSGACSHINLAAFPQSPSMAATFNTSLEHMKGVVIGEEISALAPCLGPCPKLPLNHTTP